jgi:signal transduction histidine kinase
VSQQKKPNIEDTLFEPDLDVMFHELKQPLLCLSVLGERLARRAEALKAESHPRADGIAYDANILATSVEQIQEIMMAYSTTSHLTRVESEWSIRLARMVEAIETIASSKEVSFSYELSIGERPDGPDLSAIGQIVRNLVTNAILALQEAGVSDKYLYLRTALENNNFVFEVHDSGLGVPEHLVSRIFNRGFSTRLGQGGSGYGLWVCSKLAEALGGNVVVLRSERLGGAKFILTIPHDATSSVVASVA